MREQGEPDSSRKHCAEGVFAMVLARDRSLGSIECERACTASRATKQRMSLRAAAHSSSAFMSIQNSSLAPRRRTRLLPISIHRRPLAHARALPMTQAHAHYRSSTLTLKLRHFSARREASTLLVGLGLSHAETTLRGLSGAVLAHLAELRLEPREIRRLGCLSAWGGVAFPRCAHPSGRRPTNRQT